MKVLSSITWGSRVSLAATVAVSTVLFAVQVQALTQAPTCTYDDGRWIWEFTHIKGGVSISSLSDPVVMILEESGLYLEVQSDGDFSAETSKRFYSSHGYDEYVKIIDGYVDVLDGDESTRGALESIDNLLAERALASFASSDESYSLEEIANFFDSAPYSSSVNIASDQLIECVRRDS